MTTPFQVLPPLPPAPPAPPLPPAPPVLGVLATPPIEAAARRNGRSLRVDPRVIFADTQQRPDHYSAEERTLAQKLYLKPQTAVSDVAVTELTLTFFRDTALKKHVQELLKKDDEPSDDPEDPDAPPRSTFEKQDFSHSIVIM